MRHIFKMTFLVLAVLVFFAWKIMPPEKTLRRGKDLAGGVSMVYAVDIAANEDAKAVLDSTIRVLKERVDPEGVMDISMVAQGRDRIDINMPLPSDQVKAARKQFEDALAELGRNKLSDQRLQLTMQMQGETRAAEIKTLSGGNTKREELLNAAATAYDDAQKLRAAYDAELESSKRDAMVEQVAAAEIAYNNARDAVLKTALNASDIRKIITASTRVRFIDDGGQRVPLPTAREVAESQVRNAHPESIAEIDRILQLHADYAKVRTTLDDPQDLVRMLRGAGVLEFRITARMGKYADESRMREDLQKLGPRNVQSADTRWLKINQLENWLNTKAEVEALAQDPRNAIGIFGRIGYIVEPYGGDYYMLAYDTRQTRLTQAEGDWRVSRAFQTFDERGRNAIGFETDPSGAKLLSQMTGAHVGEQMAVVLDDQVYTAPTLQGEIGASGRITGEFSKEEIDYIVRVLGGGSLQAKLSPEPISIASVGPELGADNLDRGITTAMWSAVIVAVFMCLYYFWYGAVAVIALLANALIIVGCMALSKAVFTMPGIAGLILTFGMAVDSNVLIYERIREEMNRGNDMKTCVRLGFDKALSAIVDGNMTNLIVCIVLYYTGTPEIRGFAITMGIGVVATMSATLIVSRLIFDMMLAGGWRKGSVVSTHMLPTAIPNLQNLLTPTVDWMKYRFAFFAVSAVYVSIGLAMVFWQGAKMLDNEFRGGTQVTLQFKPDPTDPTKRVMMTRKEVEAKLRELAQQNSTIPDFNQFEVFPINPQADGFTSDKFAIKTLALNNATSPVLNVVKEGFADKLESKPALAFTGSDAGKNWREVPTFVIDKPTLGANIDKPQYRQDVTPYAGGIAIVLSNINPPSTLENLRTRLDTARESEAFSDTLSRSRDVIVLEGTETAVTSAAIVVADPSVTIVSGQDRWESDLRDREWALVQEALTQDSTPASVLTFSPAIAATFTANAITATILSFIFIGIYIWVRFKTPRYSLAAVVALIHDVLVVVGLVALAEILYDNPSTHGFASSLNLLPFKIDLNLVAALLTIAGYSLNDTVVIMDRIRENRGKLPHATRDIINTSINQTFSRTLITGGTTLASCFILYVWGGEGMRAFAFALATGLIVGTYSSVAVAAPIVWSRKHESDMYKDAGVIQTT